ncbi:carbon storage regulator [Pseudomonas sp. WHRI 8822A]|uniref:carbon storage regulator n=1 Tax=Pseudomonas sp. WHRI 8822A TaxID=3162568 RepID=UPI0032EF33C3
MPLALTRRLGEEIQLRFSENMTEQDLQTLVREGISIRLTEVGGRQAVLSVAAPNTVNVVRAELLDR